MILKHPTDPFQTVGVIIEFDSFINMTNAF